MARIAEEEGRGTASRDLLERIVNDTLYRLGHTPIDTPTVRSYLEGWLVSERGSVVERSYTRYAQIIKDFLTVCGARAEAKLASIIEADILKYRDWLRAGGRSPQTVNNTIREILKQPFKVAVERGLIERNPVALMKSLKESRATKGTFSPAQMATLLSTVEGDYYGLILAGWYTGARLGDLARLQWSAVNLAERTITFAQQKTNNVICIPIHPELEAWLRASGCDPTGLARGPVFPSLVKRPIHGGAGLSNTFSKLVAAAGIDNEGLMRSKRLSSRCQPTIPFRWKMRQKTTTTRILVVDNLTNERSYSARVR